MTITSLMSASGVTLADAGMETYLIYREGIDLPEFASFTVLRDLVGRTALIRYYQDIIDVAVRDGRPLLLDTATWRASADWGALLGYSATDLDGANAAGVSLLLDLRADSGAPFAIGGCIGPRGDGYAASSGMTQQQAADYHGPQIASLATAGAEYITAMTLGDPNEAAGILDAARASGLPAVVSFTIETDGRLASGQDVWAAIEETDRLTDGYASGYLINCAHPIHLELAFGSDAPLMQRVRGIRVNASAHSHAELDAATTLDDGDPAELARRCASLVERYPRIAIVGGCCGTDARHISAISAALPPLPAR